MPQINDIRELAQQNARYVSNSPQDWMSYLDVAARLYRYSFTDALLIHAQRPDATACAEMELWNQKMSRWVNRGAKGIALLDDTGPRTRLRYVFDIADTHLVRGGKTPLLWNLDSHEHEQAILDHLVDTYGLSQTDSMNTALLELAQQLTADNLNEAMDGLAHEVADTFLEELDEDNIRVRFRELMTNSIFYTLSRRCGQEPMDVLDDDDFIRMGAFSSCSAAIHGTGSTFIGTTYPSKDADMKGAEEDYLELEKKLDEQIRQMESTHPGYDEYRYQLDEIGHDPYQLISHLTAVYEQFTRGQVKPVIKSLFEQQYLLKVWETIEIRTRMETRVGIRPTIDAFGNVSMETYTYQEKVEYEYKILNVLLKNKGFDTIARKNMDRKQTGRYDAYNLTYGNRPELFGAGSPTYSGGTTGSIGFGGSGGTGGSSGGGFRYDIPEEALSDEKFARVIAEAEKYLGMPYVWGGSSPSTSFDCSGFVCWVINNCGNGWNVGRTTANGLRGKCSYVSPANAQPGDLIFFEKTYNTVGASHVGIYVGNGMMIHCGDPISYTSINSTYWQNHFLGFGRIK